MLTIENLSKTYENGIQALNDVSLEIPRGMFGLLGPNGAGKTTLMRTIATLQEPDTGEIHMGELDVIRQKGEVRAMLGYLPQEFGVYPRLSAEAMLNHLAVLKGITRRGERREAVDHILKTTNLWDIRKQKLGTYSGGMRQRFGVAQALLGSPELIILDEPTAGLDPQERHRFLNLLSEIGERMVVILSTHIVEDVRELCSDPGVQPGGKEGLSVKLLDADTAELSLHIAQPSQLNVEELLFIPFGGGRSAGDVVHDGLRGGVVQRIALRLEVRLLCRPFRIPTGEGVGDVSADEVEVIGGCELSN